MYQFSYYFKKILSRVSYKQQTYVRKGLRDMLGHFYLHLIQVGMLKRFNEVSRD